MRCRIGCRTPSHLQGARPDPVAPLVRRRRRRARRAQVEPPAAPPPAPHPGGPGDPVARGAGRDRRRLERRRRDASGHGPRRGAVRARSRRSRAAAPARSRASRLRPRTRRSTARSRTRRRADRRLAAPRGGADVRRRPRPVHAGRSSRSSSSCTCRRRSSRSGCWSSTSTPRPARSSPTATRSATTPSRTRRCRSSRPATSARSCSGRRARSSSYGAPFPRLFRPPYGLWNSQTLSLLRRYRMLMVLWTVDTNDYRLPGSSAIVNSVRVGRPAGRDHPDARRRRQPLGDGRGAPEDHRGPPRARLQARDRPAAAPRQPAAGEPADLGDLGSGG